MIVLLIDIMCDALEEHRDSIMRGLDGGLRSGGAFMPRRLARGGAGG